MAEPNTNPSAEDGGQKGGSAPAKPPATPAAKAAPTQADRPSGASTARAKPAAGAQSAKAATGSRAQPDNGIALLKADHRKVEGLFDAYEKAGEAQKADLVRQICAELVIHTLIEEEIFYPACRRAAGQDEQAEDGLDEAQVEHDGVKPLLMDLWDGGEGDDLRDAKVKVLGEMVRHHVGEEEKPGEGVFAKAEEQSVDNPDLARRLRQRKQALQADQERGRLRPGAPVSFQLQPRPQGRYNQETEMARNNGPDRDERGRFTSDDDDRRGGYGERNQGGRYARDDDDDRRSGGGGGGRGQGGWFGDPEGHSRAAREGWDERGGGRGDDRGYRSGGRDDDDRRGGGGDRGRGQGGWFGDPEGHSRASREGWDERREEGRSYGRGRDDDDDRGGRGGRGGGEGRGWYGDPQGHARAAREGWDDRRDDDRDRGGYRSRGRDDDDDRRGGGDRGRGQGGWFGDPRGHSEASRRGWQDRR